MRPSSRLDRLPRTCLPSSSGRSGEEGRGCRRHQPGDRRPGHADARAVVDALAAAASDPGTHQYPSNRGRPELREAYARFYERRFGVSLDPETEIIPALGAKECVFNLNSPSSTRTPWRSRLTLATRSTPAARSWRAPRRS